MTSRLLLDIRTESLDADETVGMAIDKDTNLSCPSVCFRTNADLLNRSSPNGIIALYWDDLVLDRVRTTKLIGFNTAGSVAPRLFTPR